MKKMILAAAVMVLGVNAYADGFVCDNADQTLRIKVYHQTQPTLGTRNVAIMVVSNPSATTGSKTIATFSANNSVLSNAAADYSADVDLRFRGSNRKDEAIGGVTLGDLDTIALSVDYSFGTVLVDGTEVSGLATLAPRSNTDTVRIPMTCVRYLKGQ